MQTIRAGQNHSQYQAALKQNQPKLLCHNVLESLPIKVKADLDAKCQWDGMVRCPRTFGHVENMCLGGFCF